MTGATQVIIAALDVGTTTLRCHCYNEKAILLGSACDTIELQYKNSNYVEMDPEDIIEKVVNIVKKAIKVSGVTADQVRCLGISCQRASFVTWSKSTGKPFHPIITWRDLRADYSVWKMNTSLKFRVLRGVCYLLHLLTRNERYLAGSQMRVMNQQVGPRLHWILENNINVKHAAARQDAAFGTLDSWLLFRLSGGLVHATDVSHASCSGFFDPFTMDWNPLLLNLFKIPRDILPNVLDSTTTFCVTPAEIFGARIPITCSVADQSAAMFGSCCFNKGDIKCTLGTGTFVDLHTGDKPHVSEPGLYPLVAWRVKGETAFMVEGSSSDSGTILKWAQSIKLLEDVTSSAAMANSVEDTDGVCFMSIIGGLQASINDGFAATGIIGIKPTTRREHIVRAMLESIAFRVDQLIDMVKKNMEVSHISLNGGVARNDFLVQLVSDLTGAEIFRPSNTELSALGAAFLAGLESGVWQNRQELTFLVKWDQAFRPGGSKVHIEPRMQQWRAALSRFQGWYNSSWAN